VFKSELPLSLLTTSFFVVNPIAFDASFSSRLLMAKVLVVKLERFSHYIQIVTGITLVVGLILVVVEMRQVKA